MALASGSDPLDPAKSQNAALGELRGSLLWGMGLFFALVMAVVAIAVTVGGLNDGTLPIRLGLMAITLPVAMAALTRRILARASELQRMSEQLQNLYSQARLDALLDPITGLGNHRAFQEELHRQIEDAGRHDHHVALAIVDLDDLKRVNDEHGHAGGDQLLASMGRLLVNASRASDRAFRIGGDEFALILPHADADDAHAVIRRVLSSALSAETTFGRPYSFSAGVSAYPLPSHDGGRLLRNADAALYWAKRHGRTDIQVYDPERHGVSDDTRSTPELAQAIDQTTGERAIVPVFQPIFDLATGAPVGFEGLVRPDGAAFRDATALFTAAEVADRTVELDLLCIDVIAAAVGGDLGEAYLSVNISPRTLEADQFRVSDLVSILRKHDLEPDRVVLELTERESIEDMERLRDNLAACRAVGFRIAADDVGAGNAGLRLLSEVAFDIVKIDLSLVQGGVMRDSALAVLTAIQDIAARADATVVAEGIETVDQLDVIREVGITRGQGFLLANPATELQPEPIDIERLLESHQARRQALLGTWGAAVKG